MEAEREGHFRNLLSITPASFTAMGVSGLTSKEGLDAIACRISCRVWGGDELAASHFHLSTALTARTATRRLDGIYDCFVSTKKVLACMR